MEWLVIGEEYEKLKQQLVDWVRDSRSTRRVFPIFGRPGVGKTTLAQQVINNSSLKINRNGEWEIGSMVFDKILWFSASDKCIREELVNWQRDLSGVKYLLIIDDLSDEEILSSLMFEDMDDPVYSAFVEAGNEGSKVIVTSRLELEGGLPTIVGLLQDESWDSFKETAFETQQERHSILPIGIGEEICRKCDNIPAVVLIIASILSSKLFTPREWKHFNDLVMTSVPNPISSVLFTAKLLNEPLNESKTLRNKRCFFASCSLLPKNHHFTKYDIIRLWKALQTCNVTKAEVDDDNLDGLHTETEVYDDLDGYTETQVDDDLYGYTETEVDDDLDGITERQVDDDLDGITETKLDEIFEEFANKGFFVEAKGDKRDYICDPVARYYNISELGYELMKYVAGDDYCLVESPTSEIEHESIRHLGFIIDPSWQAPSWLTNTTQLQSLLFWPRKLGHYLNLSNFDLSLLKGRCFLHFDTACCENFKLLESIKVANFNNSISIKNLEIGGCKMGDDLEVVWRLFDNVCHLKLSEAPQLTSLPEGLESATMLKHLSLCWLAEFNVLPKWIARCTWIYRLTIHHCPKLTTLTTSLGFFPALEELEIRYCSRLKQFPKSLPKLKVLRIHEFNRLEELLSVSRKLEVLEVNSCNELKWNDIKENNQVRIWEGLMRLRSLKLSNISALNSLPSIIQSLTTIEQLVLSRLYNLETLPEWIKQFTQLRRLAIQYCPNLTNLPTEFGSLSSLEHLEIECCTGLKQLPASFQNLKSLTQFEVRKSMELERRCREPDGKDWPLIQHIKTVILDVSEQQEDSASTDAETSAPAYASLSAS